MAEEDTPSPNWIRPSDVAYPNIWLKENGIVIRDVTPDLQPYVTEHMLNFFIRDEPCGKSVNMHDDPQALEDIPKIWNAIVFPHNVSIVALAEGTPGADLKPVGSDDPPKILGANLLLVTHKNDPPFPPVEELTTSTSIRTVLNATFFDLSKQVDVFEKYNVDHFLDAAGLSVHPDTRGTGLGLQILRARIELCRGLRIPLTKTVFTAIQSQKISEKAGFQLIFEKNYDDFVNADGKKIFPNMPNVKTMQLKVHTITK